MVRNRNFVANGFGHITNVLEPHWTSGEPDFSRLNRTLLYFNSWRDENRYMQLKEQLNFYLELKDMTATKLAKLSGVSKSTISDWLTGTSPRNIEQVKAVANVLNVTLDELCFGKDENKLSDFREEINAGVFEVVLRRVKK